MLRELLVSIVSGIVVALVLGIFRGGRGVEPPRQSVRYDNRPVRRRGSLFGGLVRFVLSVAGGLALAIFAMPFIFGRRFGNFGHPDRFDGFQGLSSHAPILILTVVGTIIVWSLLSALTRR